MSKIEQSLQNVFVWPRGPQWATVAHLQGVPIGRMNGTQLMVIDISAIISILGPLNSDLLSDKLLENYKHKHHHHQTNQSVHDLDSSS